MSLSTKTLCSEAVWGELLGNPSQVPESPQGKKLSKLLASPPPFTLLEQNCKDMKNYEGMPKTAPSRNCKRDHDWQAIQKKLEKHMNLMVQWKEEGNEKYFWAAMGMVRSAWEDINQQRKKMMLPQKLHFLLDKREDDDSVKLLSETENRNIMSSRLKMQMEAPQKGQLQSYSEWKAQKSKQFMQRNCKVQNMMENRNQEIGKAVGQKSKMQQVSPYCSPSSREPTSELGKQSSGFETAASGKQHCSCNESKLPGGPHMAVLGPEAKNATMVRIGLGQSALASIKNRINSTIAKHPCTKFSNIVPKVHVSPGMASHTGNYWGVLAKWSDQTIDSTGKGKNKILGASISKTQKKTATK